MDVAIDLCIHDDLKRLYTFRGDVKVPNTQLKYHGRFSVWLFQPLSRAGGKKIRFPLI